MTSGLPSAVPRHRSCVTGSGAYVCSCGHKLSLTAALPLTPTPPAALTVSARFRSAVNPMTPLAIPSRRCRSASFLPPIARMPYRQPRSSHPQRRSRLHSKPPARSLRLSSATPVHRPFRAERIYRRRPMAMSGLSTPPGARRLPSLRTLPASVDCVLSIASPEHFWPRLRYSPLRLKTAAVFGSIDCSLRLHSASSTPPSLLYGGMALHSGYTRKLSLATTFRLSPTPLLRHGVGPPPFHRQPETSACYSGPSIPCRRSPSSGRRKPSISALLPTHGGNSHCHSVRRLPSFIVCDAMPTPGSPICGAPMH